MRKRGVYSIIVAILVVGVTTLASLLYVDRMQFGNRLQGRYQSELYNLMGNVQSLETNLAKVTVTGSPTQAALLFGDIWRQAGSAADRINSLPITHAAISETSKFLAQVSDFSYALLKTINGGGKLSDEEWSNLEALRSNASYLGEQLFALQQEMEDGRVKWSEIRYEGGRLLAQAQDNLLDTKFSEINKQMQNHPTLIYDGPFSENVLNIKPRVLDEGEVTMEQARGKVEKLFGKDKIEEIGLYSSKDGSAVGDGTIPSYPFYVKLKGRDKDSTIDIDISKNGGHIIFMLDSRAVGQPKIDVKKAIDIGLKFLNDMGYKDMIPSFSQKTDSVLVTNYVRTQSNGETNVVIYPDQIKVKIALDNGEIVGVEAEKYLIAHYDRDLPKAKISVEEARAKANSNIKVTNTRMALIPLLSKREVFCYEFVGKVGDSTFIVYINAENGNEENILQILDTPEGQLAI